MTSKAGMGYTQFSSNVIKIKKISIYQSFWDFSTVSS